MSRYVNIGRKKAQRSEHFLRTLFNITSHYANGIVEDNAPNGREDGRFGTKQQGEAKPKRSLALLRRAVSACADKRGGYRGGAPMRPKGSMDAPSRQGGLGVGGWASTFPYLTTLPFTRPRCLC